MRVSDIVIPVAILLGVLLAVFAIDNYFTNRKSKP